MEILVGDPAPCHIIMTGFQILASEPDVHLPAYPALRFDIQSMPCHCELSYDNYCTVQSFFFYVQSSFFPKALFL